MKKEIALYIFILLVVNGGCITAFYLGKAEGSKVEPITVIDSDDESILLSSWDTDEYNKGFNDALDHIALVNLEFSELKGEKKTFGELADICRHRAGIPESER